MFGIELIINEASNQIIRAATGQLFTKDQIKKITSHSIGRHFADLFPSSETELQKKQRFDEAKRHIEGATRIISEMQLELETHNVTLQKVMRDIEEKQEVVKRYTALSETKKEAIEAVKAELETTLRRELIRQSKEGKTLRRFVSLSIWLITLILGAALGAYFIDIVAWAFPKT